MSVTNDLGEVIAVAATNTRFDALPADAVETTKKSLLDMLGVVLAGSGANPDILPILAFVRDAGGKPESTLLGFGGKVPAGMAALVNGALAHCLDFDDRTPWGAHGGSSLIPTLLALAERRQGVHGKCMIEAIAAGQDIFVRLRCNVTWKQDWNLSPLLGTFAAAVGGCRVLGLGPDQMMSALGIASLQAGGTMQVVYGGGQLRGMYGGFSAGNAVNAVLLAEQGLTGVSGVFEGQAGLLNVHFRGQYDRAAMLDNLGTDYRGATMLYKPWPAVGIAHTYIHATLELMKEQQLRAADIACIRAYVSEYQSQVGFPLNERQSPRTPLEAKYSLPYCVALAAVKGRVGLSDFTDAALKDDTVMALAKKVLPVPLDGAEWASDRAEGRIEIVTVDGRSFERWGDMVPGSTQNPLTWDDLTQKFLSCAALSATPIARSRLDDVIARIGALEEVEDVADIMRALA